MGKVVARALLHKAGGLDGVRYWNRRGFRILMYHNFPDSFPRLQESLAQQCRHMLRHYNVVSLEDIARSLREGEPLPPHALAVTVDDGYRDFVNAHPVFRAYGIPATVFLVSGFLDGKLWLWWDQLRHMVERCPRPAFQASFFPGELPVWFPLETPEQRRLSTAALTKMVKRLSNEERARVMARLPEMMEVDLPVDPPPDAAPLAWSDVRRLAKEGVDFGAHTVTHPILSRVADAEALSHEIAHSKKRIEDETSNPVLHFSYPYGFLEDFNEESVKALDRCSFRTAVTTEKGLDGPDAHPFWLKRFGVEPTTPDLYFREFLAGLHTGPEAARS